MCVAQRRSWILAKRSDARQGTEADGVTEEVLEIGRSPWTGGQEDSLNSILCLAGIQWRAQGSRWGHVVTRLEVTDESSNPCLPLHASLAAAAAPVSMLVARSELHCSESSRVRPTATLTSSLLSRSWQFEITIMATNAVSHRCGQPILSAGLIK